MNIDRDMTVELKKYHHKFSLILASVQTSAETREMYGHIFTFRH